MFEQTFKNIDDVLWKEAGCTTELDYTEQTSWMLFLKYLDDLEKDNAQKAELAGKSYSYIIEGQYRWAKWAAPKKKDGTFDHDKALTGKDLIEFVDRKLFPYLEGFRERAEHPDTIEYKIGEIFGEIKNKFSSGYSLRDALELIDGLRFRSQAEKHELSHLYEAKIRNMGNAGRNGGEYYTPRPLIRAMIRVTDPKIGERIYDGAAGSCGFLCEPFDYLLPEAKTTKDRDTLQKRTFFDRREKTLVFCATQEHALAVRDLINQMKTGSSDPNYCVRVTADDGARGEQWLRAFQDNEKTIPAILTTSQKLSTGVDARNIRNIVLMRPINSMIEFKQIIGRGTRLFEGKDYFTIIDFVKAYEHFSDPEWDGEPIAPEPREPRPPRDTAEPEPRPPSDPNEPEPRPEKLKIKLADGKERTIQHISATSFWDPSGKPISAKQFIEGLFGQLPQLFKDEAELRALWSRPDTRKTLLKSLEERGFAGEQLREITRAIDAEKSDLFDVLAYIAYAKNPLTRAERVAVHRSQIMPRYDGKLQTFLDFVLTQYENQGVAELDQEKLGSLLELKYHTVNDAAAQLGGIPAIRDVFVGFQAYLYDE